MGFNRRTTIKPAEHLENEQRKISIYPIQFDENLMFKTKRKTTLNPENYVLSKNDS